MGSLSVPSPALSAASSRAGSRSASYSESGARRLSFRGQCVNVVLPETVLELEDLDADVVERVEGIRDYDKEDVSP